MFGFTNRAPYGTRSDACWSAFSQLSPNILCGLFGRIDGKGSLAAVERLCGSAQMSERSASMYPRSRVAGLDPDRSVRQSESVFVGDADRAATAQNP